MLINILLIFMILYFVFKVQPFIMPNGQILNRQKVIFYISRIKPTHVKDYLLLIKF